MSTSTSPPVALPPPPSWLTLALLTSAVLLVALLVNRLAPTARRRVPRVVFPFIGYLLTLGVEMLARRMDLGPSWVTVPHQIAWLLARLTVINAAALTIFDVTLPRFRLSPPSIVHELSLGAGYVVTLFAFLRLNGVDFTSLVATSAVVTAILAFSLQATLGNMMGGIAMQLDDSIHIGDWVRLDGIEGLVKHIRWRHTVIETRNWDTVIVPNSNLLAQNIIILGKRTDCPVQHRMWVHFNVDFRFAPALVIDTVEKALRGAPLPNVAIEPAPNCVCMDFAHEGGESFARYAVRYWLTDLAADDPTNSSVRARIYAALARANIPLALPAATLFVSNDDVAHTERKSQRKLHKRVEALRGVNLFASISAEERDTLAQRLRHTPFARGEVITRQGAEAHWLYILTKGIVEVRVAAGGKETAVNRLEAPSFFGEHGLMTGAPRSATVVAVTEVECYRLDKASLDDILQARPEIANELATVLAERKMNLDKAVDGLDVRARSKRVTEDSSQILRKIQKFFGLGQLE